MTNNQGERSLFLDQLRALAVIHMIFFHFNYDLMLFGLVDIDFQNDWIWWIQPRWIVALFMTSVGASLYLAHAKKVKWIKFWKRWLKLAIFALIISVSTYIMFPKHWIYFGTLHSIALCSLLALPFVKLPKVALVAGVAIVSTLFIESWSWPWFQLPHSSMDYIPPMPWLGFCLIGIALASFKVFEKNPLPKNIKGSTALAKVGQKAFIIYLLHQPILYGGISLFVYFQ